MVKVKRKKETVKMVLARAKEGLHFIADDTLRGDVHRKNCFYDGKKLERIGDYYLLDSLDKIVRLQFRCSHCNLNYWNPVCNSEQNKFDQLLYERYF